MKFVQAGRTVVGALVLLGFSACTGPPAPTDTSVAAAQKPVPVTAVTTTTTAVTFAPPPPPPTPTTTPTTTKPTTTTAPKPRVVKDTTFAPFAHTEGVVLHYPTQFVERVGFHESSKTGGRTLGLLPPAADWLDLPSRNRKTNARTAADIVSRPDGVVRAPVTGTVLRASTYTLYCKYTDSFLVIEPDARPGWEVKLLHISGLMIVAGERVEAGVTPVAAHPTRLPFRSQVDDYTAAPAWPHVHLEVVDPNIKNPPGVGGRGCS